MTELNPIFFSSGSASAVVAPPQAIVVSTRAKFVTPGNRLLGNLLRRRVGGREAERQERCDRDAHVHDNLHVENSGFIISQGWGLGARG